MRSLNQDNRRTRSAAPVAAGRYTDSLLVRYLEPATTLTTSRYFCGCQQSGRLSRLFAESESASVRRYFPVGPSTTLTSTRSSPSRTK